MTARIKTLDGGGTFGDTISSATPAIQAIAREARMLIANVMPGVVEVPWARQKATGYGVGPRKMSEHFCYIAPQTAHVNLGFFYGADLDDPQGLLEGTGKALRHIKLRTREDVRKPAVRKILIQASRYLPKLRTPKASA